MIMHPRSIVAVILSASVAIFIIAGAVRYIMFPGDAGDQALWADIIKVIVGGLLTFIAVKVEK